MQHGPGRAIARPRSNTRQRSFQQASSAAAIVLRNPLDQEHFHPAAGGFASGKPCRDHAGIVQNQERPFPQKARQRREQSMIALAVIFAKNQEPRLVSLRQRMRGYALRW